MLLKPSLISSVASHSLIPLTKTPTAGMLRLSNTIIFSKVASTLQREAVIFHFMSCTQCIAYSSLFKHPVPRKRDAQRVTPCAAPPVPPPPSHSAEEPRDAQSKTGRLQHRHSTIVAQHHVILQTERKINTSSTAHLNFHCW